MTIGRAKHVIIKGHNRIAEAGDIADFGKDFEPLSKAGAVVAATEDEIKAYTRGKGAVPLVGKNKAKEVEVSEATKEV